MQHSLLKDKRRSNLHIILLFCWIVALFGVLLLKSIWTILLFLPLVIYCLVWCFYYKVFTFGLKNYRIYQSVYYSLIDANIFIGRFKNSRGYLMIDVPRIKVKFPCVLYIEDKPAYHEKLMNLDLNSALGSYAVADKYLSNDFNWLILKLIDYNVSYRYCFNSFKELVNEVNHSNNALLIDKRLNVSYSHILIVGKTGSGKSYFCQCLILELLLNDCFLWISDPKNADLAIIGEELEKKGKAKVASNFSSIIQMITDFHFAMLEREKEVHDYLHEQLNRTYADMNLPANFLIIDEFGALMAHVADLKVSERNRVMNSLKSVIFQGRQLGFFLLIVMQKSDSTALPTAIRDNIGFKLALGNNDTTTLLTIFGHSADLPKIKMHVGEGFYIMDESSSNIPQKLETPLLNFDVIAALRRFNT